ncbi:hypothetical protein CTI12_AA532480 [Artemisia annua]|uniref:Sugar phosphate transporter domain-containing protein n=1 Tax=Artemisia annua TaxID=35608 RepID=A0A2U1L458_ARTAN|nr:hypothetical protein CTI12_AA532480 [Artemisia annua]
MAVCQIVPVLTLGVAQTMRNLLTNISIGRVAVSFTHTIKAMEPFFTVLFSSLLLSEIGFGSAMASNVSSQSHNVPSKKFMVMKECLRSCKYGSSSGVSMTQNLFSLEYQRQKNLLLEKWVAGKSCGEDGDLLTGIR